jgi:hypothetical protein
VALPCLDMSQPSSGPSAVVTKAPWWGGYIDEDGTVRAVAIDVEMVSIPRGGDFEQVIDKRHGKETFIDLRNQKKMSYKEMGGMVHICRFGGQTLLSPKIKHSSGSFLANCFTMTINGIRYNDLEDRTNLEDVRRDVEKILKNNVAIRNKHQFRFECPWPSRCRLFRRCFALTFRGNTKVK